MKLLEDFIQSTNKLISEAPTTNLTVIVPIICALFSVVMYWAGVLRGINPEPIGFSALLAFLATWLGIGNHRFKIKRETDLNFLKAKNGHTEDANPIREQVDSR
jgi:hypothetical protein